MADLATLGFAVDSSPLARAKSAMQDMVPAARGAQNATEAMVGAVNGAKAAADGLAGSAGRAGAGLAAQSATVTRLANEYKQLSDVQRRINAATGVTGVTLGGDRGADIAAYGREMDALRAKFNPLFAAGQQYKATLAEIDRAVKVGAISEKEYAQALMNTKVAFTSQVNALRGVSAKDDFFNQTATGATRAGKAVQGLSFDARNLSYQLVDVGQGLLMGQSPFMIFAQQAGQIGQIAATSEKGIKGLFAEIGSGVAKVLTPMRLLTVGVAGIAIGLLALIKNAVDSSKAMDDLAKSINTTRSLLHGLEQVAGGRGINTDEFAAGMKSFGDQVYLAKRNMGDLVGLFRANGIGPVKNLQDAMQKVADLVARTKDDQQAQKLLVEAGLPANEQWVRYMRDLAKGIDNATASTVQFNDAAEQNMIAKAREFDKAWDSAVTKLVNGFKAAAITIADALTNIKIPDWLKTFLSLGATVATSVMTMGLGPIGSAVSAGVTATKNYMSSGDSFSSRFGAAGTNAANDNSALQSGLDNWAKNFRSDYFRAPSTAAAAGPAPKTRDELLNDNRIAQQRISLLGQMASVDDQVKQKELELEAAFLATGQGIGSRRAEMLQLVREQALGITQIKAQSDAYKVQATTIGMSIGQTAAYTAEQNRLNEATRNHQILTEADRKAIHAAAQEMGKAAQTAAMAAANDNAMFAVQTAFLSDIDQQIASVQRNLHGNAWQEYMNDGLSATMRLADNMRQLASLTKDVARGLATDFVSQIRNGASAMDALKTAGLNALGKIADKLAQMAVDNLWSNALGGASSGGGLLGIVGKLFGVGGGGAAVTAGLGGLAAIHHAGGIAGESAPMRHIHPAYFDDAVRYHNGGIAGLAPDEVPAILQRGERIIPRGQAGGAQGVHVTVGVSVDENGNLQAYVKDVAESTTAAGVSAAMTGPTFTSRVAKAVKTGKSLRQIA